MPIYESFKKVIASLGMEELTHPIFYNTPIGIRFNIGDNGNEVYIDKSGEELSINPNYITACLERSLKIVICDRDTIIATAGVSKKEYAEAKISSEADELIENRCEYIWNVGDSEKFVTGRSNEKISVLSPIIRSGDIIGAVVSVSGEKEPADQMEIKMIQTAASFLSRQLEE